MARKLTVGSRRSDLARVQGEWALAELRRAWPGRAFEWQGVQTRGDRPAEPLDKAPGAFTSELERALLDGQIDLAVHSMKDLPTALTPGTALAAVPLRVDPRDALVSRHGAPLASLPRGARVGTGSPRRRAQLLFLRPDLRVEPLRGNVDSRLAQLKEQDWDAIVVAMAGLLRLGLPHRATEVFAPQDMTPAAAQGALALQVRAGDEEALRLCAPLNHQDSHAAVTAERRLLEMLHAGCRGAAGAWAREDGDGRLRLLGMAASADGRAVLRVERAGSWDAPLDLAAEAAEGLARLGARELLGMTKEASQ